MTVDEYSAKFDRLSRFALHLIPTEADAAEKLQRGLNPRIYTKMVIHRYETRESVVDAAKRVENMWEDNKLKKKAATTTADGGTATKKQKTQPAQTQANNSQPSRNQGKQQNKKNQNKPPPAPTGRNDGCFHRGKKGHLKKDCRALKREMAAQSVNGPPPPTYLPRFNPQPAQSAQLSSYPSQGPQYLQYPSANY